ncbi:YiaA/YiaB family inner membrane protein [Spirillospora sp. NPDC048911]|uniref:YiaA/YiaB family inner membrane protein n=1 Tax=Spirillospora sp. NPDC048911 TaxID=3364527 RepID=UPI003713CE79
MNALTQLKGTTAFFIQAIISFAVAVTAMVLGIAYMPAPVWIRAFLALGGLYLITSTFTLAKVIRDRQEAGSALTGRPEGPPQVLPPNAPYVDPSSASWS